MTFEKKPMVPIVNEGLLYANGCLLSNSTVDAANRIVIAPGQVRDSTNTFDINVISSLEVDLTVQGLGGQTEAGGPVDAWYAIFVLSSKLNGGIKSVAVRQTVNENALPEVPNLSENSITYDMNRFVGWIKYTTSSVTIEPFTMVGDGGNFRTTYLPKTHSLFVFTTNVFTVVPLAFPGFIPPTTSSFQGLLRIVNTAITFQSFVVSIDEVDTGETFAAISVPGDLTGREYLLIPAVRTSGTNEIFLSGNFVTGPLGGDNAVVATNSYSFSI